MNLLLLDYDGKGTLKALKDTLRNFAAALPKKAGQHEHESLSTSLVPASLLGAFHTSLQWSPVW